MRFLKILGCLSLIVTAAAANPLPAEYDVVWTNMSANASESMPCGGGGVGLNVWVEGGDLLIYVSQSGTFDENNTFLKQGRTRVQLSPNPFDQPDSFEQRLVLHDGHIEIKAKKGSQDVQLDIWVDVFRPVAHVECSSTEAVDFSVTYESWRTADRVVPDAERHQCFSYTGYPGEVITYHDEIAATNNTVAWHHRNRNDKLLFNHIVEQQGLTGVSAQMVNTQGNRTFGGILQGPGLVSAGQTSGTYANTSFSGWKLSSPAAALSHSCSVVMHTAQTDTLAEWQNALAATVADASAATATARDASKAWWNAFWERSWIVTEPETYDATEVSDQIGRNYQLFRYMLGCNAYGEYPSKFNGSLFTFDPVYVNSGKTGTPDYRTSTDILAVPHVEVAKALRFIWENFSEPIQVEDVTAATNLSRRSLTRLFQQHLHRSVGSEIARKRIEHAQKLLTETDHKAWQIAEMSGFSSMEHLSKAFTRIVGQPPSTYRRKHKPQ